MRPDILTVSGNYFDFLDPEKNIFNIHDIAHGLSNVCRFGGHCRKFYSVAQHSVFVSHLVPQEYALQGLMHDAAEAFIGDVASPLKACLPSYKRIESRVEKVVMEKFGISLPLHPSVKNADLIMLATEQRDLMPEHDDEWPILKGVNPMPVKVVPVSSKEAYDVFMHRYSEIADRRYLVS